MHTAARACSPHDQGGQALLVGYPFNIRTATRNSIPEADLSQGHPIRTSEGSPSLSSLSTACLAASC